MKNRRTACSVATSKSMQIVSDRESQTLSSFRRHLNTQPAYAAP